MNRCARFAPSHHGHAAVDYLLVVALVAIAFALGRDSAIEPLLGAIAEHYRRFTWALSLP